MESSKAGRMVLLVGLLVTCASLIHVEASRILLLPAHHGSHVGFFSQVGEALLQDGHEVHILVAESLAKLATKHKLQTISLGDVPPFMSDEEMANSTFHGERYPFYILSQVGVKANRLCDDLFQKKAFMDNLHRMKFDLILIDNIDAVRCMYIVPYVLGVPYITVGARHDAWMAGLPALPSIEGQHNLMVLDSQSTFWDRLKNTFVMVYNWHFPLMGGDPKLLEKYASHLPKTTFNELYRKSEMFIMNVESLCTDFPRIQGFHYQFIGGLGCAPAEPLTGELKTFVDGAKDGIIVFTFGSAVKVYPPSLLEKLLDTFRAVPQRVIMRYEGETPKNAPKNVYFSSWVPQNDLLGHPKAKLFITHGGNNGQLEAVYHGVPVLTMPLFGDQPYNAKRAELHGYSLTVNPRQFTSEELTSTIKELISEPKYKETIQECSAVFKAMPKSGDVVKFWVDFVLKFGGKYLKPAYHEFPLWKVFMLDILAFVVGVVLVKILVLYCVCKTLCCRSKSSWPKKKAE